MLFAKILNLQKQNIKELNDFLLLHIGIISSISFNHLKYEVNFNYDIPKDLSFRFIGKTRNFSLKEIKHFSKNKEYLQHFIDAYKFGI